MDTTSAHMTGCPKMSDNYRPVLTLEKNRFADTQEKYMV